MIYQELDFAKTAEEANKRAETYKYSDPYPDIDPALLNKSDIAKYAAKTSMIYPFDPTKLKPASYEVKLGNEVLYWDKDGKKQHLIELSTKNSITLRQNSITYVGVETIFQIPFYIALRFNLTITHVHRGLLLGTGPLIDPGFKGKLMIPIHNLTTNDYIIRPGDDLIAVEFTKLSRDIILKAEDPVLEKDVYGMNVKKPDLSFDDYINNAIKPLKSVESSLEQTIGKAKKEVEKAGTYIDKIREESRSTARIITWAGIFVAATLVLTSLTVFFQTRSLISDANKYVSDSTISLMNELPRNINLSNNPTFQELNRLLSKQNDQIESIYSRISTLEDQLKKESELTRKEKK